MTSTDLTPIMVALARIEEKQEANKHRVNNLSMKIDGLDAKIELRPCREDIAAIVEPIKARIDRVENTQTWILRSSVGGASIVGAGLIAIGKKIGLV